MDTPDNQPSSGRNKNTVIGIVVAAIIIIGGIVVFANSQKETTEPTTDNNTNNNSVTPNPTSTPDTLGNVKQFTVSGSNFKFSPTEIRVKQGDIVRITFKNESGFHDLKIDEFSVTTKQAQGPTEETIEFVANKTGTFEFYCSVGQHRQMGMKGNLIVE